MRPKENMAHAERDRMRSPQDRMTAAETVMKQTIVRAGSGMITYTGESYPSFIEYDDRTDAMMYGITGQIMGGAGAPTDTSMSGTSIEPYSYPSPTISPGSYTEFWWEKEQASYVARIEVLEKTLAERDELIEALSADLEDIDALRAEVIRLSSIAPPLIAGVVAAKDGWITWTAPKEVCPCPIDPKAEIEVILRGYGGQPNGYRSVASFFVWHDCGLSSIVAFKIIPTPYIPAQVFGSAI